MAKYILVDIARMIYDDRKVFDNFKDACQINLALQCAGEGDFIVPMKVEDILIKTITRS